VIASDPPSVVHLITRAQGGLHDYQAFLHEAGHALHFAGLDPELPYTFRRLSRDHALTEIYSFLLESITREPGWHSLHFGVDEAEDADRAEAARFLEVLLFRRYAAKLDYELRLWSDFENASDYAKTYEDNLRGAVGFRYRADGYLIDMDGDFYSADYLRAWIRTAQLRAHLRSTIGGDGRAPAGALPGGHPADERGDSRPHRLRPARHRAPRRGARRRLARLGGGPEVRDRRDRESGERGREADEGGLRAHRALHAHLIGRKRREDEPGGFDETQPVPPGRAARPEDCVLGCARSLRLRTRPASFFRNDHRSPATSDVPPKPPTGT
jgi:hypothetical protein